MVAYHPFDETIWDDPFPVYKQLRDEAPAYYLEEFDCWFISRFEDVWKLETDQRNFTSQQGTTTTHLLTHQTPSAPNLTYYDGREHTKVRSYFNPFFLPAYLKRLEPRIRDFARDAVDAVVEEGRADAVHDLGGPVAVRTACSLLGIPLEDANMVMDWVNGFFHREPGTRGTTAIGLKNQKELGLYLFDLARRAEKQGAPEDTVLEKLLREDLLERKQDAKDIAIHLNMMIIGGTETFPKILSATLCRLWENPDQRARCAADPELLPHAFHEALRYDMPTHMLGRTIATGFELHGQKLEAGSAIMFLWGSANRDEREFPDPDRFDVDRRAPRILSFGAGQHMCLGHHVAKFEGRALLEEVMRRIPDYEVDRGGIERIQSEFFRGFWKMPVTFAPGAR
ncbi:MAG: cytochrome P450 [Myxococcales bacterium]|nr:cytochrome P450 [Myxococcales bacterium]